MKNLYDILGIEPEASAKEIREAWKQKSKENHPDKGGSDKKMAEINEAYNTLKDDVKRAHYDNTGETRSKVFEQEFLSLMNNVIMTLASQADVTQINMVTASKEVIRSKIEEQIQVKDSAKQRIETIMEMKKRFKSKKDKTIQKMLNINYQQEKNTLGIAQHNIEFFNYCIDLLKHYKYETDDDEGALAGFLSGSASGTM